jgi:hypothetical protein
MLAFVSLPVFLVLLTLVSVPARLLPVRPHVRATLDPAVSTLAERHGDRVVRLANRLGTGPPAERESTMLALADETERCPAYASFTVRRLVAGLDDAEPRIRAATAFTLGALGPTASDALPFLRAARGRTDAHVDHVLAEAIWWIEHGESLAGYGECDPLPTAALKSPPPAVE